MRSPSRLKPEGRFIAVKLVAPGATMRYVNGCWLKLETAAGLVMTGGGGLTVRVSVLVLLLVTLVAVRPMVETPVAVGDPLITPFVALSVSPAGKPLAEKVATVFVPIW